MVVLVMGYSEVKRESEGNNGSECVCVDVRLARKMFLDWADEL